MMNNLFKLSVIFGGLLLSSCASTEGPKTSAQLNEKMQNELKQAAANQAKQAPSAAVNKALLPDLKIAMPQTASKKIEPRFDLVVNNAPAAQVLMGIVNGTPYSMLLPASITGTISVNLKNVTVPEALDSLRALYGFEYTIDGTRIMVEPQTMQTRVFQVNYIVGSRKGSSDTQVNSGSVRSNSTSGAQGTATGAVSNNSTGTNNTSTLISSSISTTSNNDFWGDLGDSLNSLIGKEDGRKVIVNTQSGVIVVRAMPTEIRQVEKFLRLMQVNIERQVILEAKILNVQLNNNSQSGVNWSVFGRTGNTSGAIGSINANGSLATTGSGSLVNGDLSATAANNVLTNSATTSLGGPLFAVALQGANISALLSFLETQGDVEVLSSPRIATINNQKAVLKVGTDEFFVTGVSQNTVASVGATTSSPQVTLQSFFSGISLDVTPQIDKDDNIILHMHPSISQVSTVNKQLTLGGANSQINLPLASSAVSETDSIVRTRDGSVIAIGGLMTESKTTSRSKVPGLGDLAVVGKAFRQNGDKSSKSELVILLKATVIQGNDSWSDDMLSSQQRIKEMKRNLTEN
ncbi:MAG TPA: pilus (MSHA type) biogenesis protein MshL [Methylophilaceae bacterium]